MYYPGDMLSSTLFIPIGEAFPRRWEEHAIVLDDKTELLVKFDYVYAHRWKVENGVVIGALVDFDSYIIENVRPSSKGKLRLVN